MNEKQVFELLRASLRQELLTGQDIFLAATKKELGKKKNNPEWIKSNFSNLVEQIQSSAYEIYKTEERKSVAFAFRKVFGKMLTPESKTEDFFSLLENNFWALDRFFLSLTQGRRPRAGKAFEHIIKVLFNILGYPYTPQPVINGQPDFLLPSEDHFKQNAMDCIIFTVKRTLRERWRQIVTEGTRGHLFYLATIDENIAARDLDEIKSHRIYLVMPERIRMEKYQKQTNVISFEAFFQLHLDPAMHRWRENGII